MAKKKGLIDRLESRLVSAIAEARAAQPILPSAPGGDDDAEASDADANEGSQTEISGIGARGADEGSFDDDGPVWPDEAAESAMRAEVADRGETLSARAAREAAEAAAEEKAEKMNLPPLDDLIEKIPADVRETLEDLFRARFVKVARAPKKALKS